MRKPRKFICRGIEYGSIKAFARAFGLCERTVQTRLGSGMTPEEIISKPIRQTRRKYVPCDPSIQNCLNCQKEECNCDLPPRPGETNTGDVLKNVINGGYESPETVYHCVLNLEAIEEGING